MKPDRRSYLTYAVFFLTVVAFIALLVSFVLHFSAVRAAWEKLLSACFPLLCAAITLLILLPSYDRLYGFFTKRLAKRKYGEKISGILALLCVYLAFFGLLTLIVVVILPQFKPLFALLMDSADYLTRLNAIGKGFAERSPFLGERFLRLTEALNTQIASSLSEISTLLPSILEAAKSVVSHISGWLLGFIISIYALLARDRLKAVARKINAAIFPKKTAASIAAFIKALYENTLHFLSARAYNAVLLGAASCLLFFVLRLKFYAALCVLLMFGCFVPVFGPLAASALGTVIVLLTDSHRFLPYLIILISLYLLDLLVLLPRFAKDGIRLSLVETMLAVLIGWYLRTLTGAVLAVPVWCTVRAALRAHHAKKKAENAAPPTEKKAQE